ncbi:hypothetical protein LQW54_001256 [Pestalotiopsis sp. IQ-011]
MVVRIWVPSELVVDTTDDGVAVDSASLLVAVDPREDDTVPKLAVVVPDAVDDPVACTLKVIIVPPEDVSGEDVPADVPVPDVDDEEASDVVSDALVVVPVMTGLSVSVSAVDEDAPDEVPTVLEPDEIEPVGVTETVEIIVADDDSEDPIDVPTELSGVPVDEAVCSPVPVLVLSPYEVVSLEVASEAVVTPVELLKNSVVLPEVVDRADDDEMGNDSVEVMVETGPRPSSPVRVRVTTLMKIPLSGEEVAGLVEAPLVNILTLSEIGRLEVVPEAVVTLNEVGKKRVVLSEVGNGAGEDEMLSGNDSVDVMVETGPVPSSAVKVKVTTLMMTLLPGGGKLMIVVGLTEAVETSEEEPFADVTKGGTGVVTTGGPVVVLLTGPGAVSMLWEEVTLDVCPLLLEDSVPVVSVPENVDDDEDPDASDTEVVTLPLFDDWLEPEVTVSEPVDELDNEPEIVLDVVEARVSLARLEVYVVATVLPETVMTDVKTMIPPPELAVPVVPVGPYVVDVPLLVGNGAVEVLLTAVVVDPETIDSPELVKELVPSTVVEGRPEDPVPFVVGIEDELTTEIPEVIVETRILLVPVVPEDSPEVVREAVPVSVPVEIEVERPDDVLLPEVCVPPVPVGPPLVVELDAGKGIVELPDPVEAEPDSVADELIGKVVG